MKIAFLADLHLNFVSKFVIDKLIKEMSICDMAVIAGDISEAPSLQQVLDYLAKGFNKPIYFVLGNHDIYYGSFGEVTKRCWERNGEANQLAKWLTPLGIVELTKDTCLIGTDGWYDCRNGDFFGSDMELNDFKLIYEMKAHHGKYNLFSLCNKLGDETAAYIDEMFPKAALKYKNIIFLTHVPPFIDASLYLGKPASQASLPFFSNKAAGDAIKRFAKTYPKINVCVACGHSHDPAYYKFDNITTYVVGAKYYEPSVYGVFEPK